MQYGKPNIQPLGEQAILLTWDAIIDENLLYFLLEIKQKIENNYTKVKVEVINTYNSLLVNYSFAINNAYNEILQLKQLISTPIDYKLNSFFQFTLPVCYSPKFGLDLALLSEQNQLSISEIIELHTQPNYTIYFTGFLPGFLYLGGLHKKLYISRKKTPRLQVQKGTVAIGEKQTGIYPQNSPGGWHIIGKTPVSLFNIKNEPSCEILPSDEISFKPISKLEFENIKIEQEKGIYELKKWAHND